MEKALIIICKLFAIGAMSKKGIGGDISLCFNCEYSAKKILFIVDNGDDKCYTIFNVEHLGWLQMEKKTVFMIGNAHLDPAWVWSWQEGSCETKATIRSALYRMNEFPDFKFVCSSASEYQWVQDFDD